MKRSEPRAVHPALPLHTYFIHLERSPILPLTLVPDKSNFGDLPCVGPGMRLKEK